MLKLRSMAILAVAALMLATGVQVRAQGQRERQGAWGQQGNNNQSGQKLNGPGPHRGEWLRNHQNLPLQEQERVLHNDPAFRRLPPEKQQELTDRLRRFNSLPPEQRQRMLERMETFEHLPQPERQRVRDLWGQLRTLPDDRRFAVRQAARQLSELPPDQRERALNSPQFRQRFSPQEQDIVRGLASLQPNR